MSESMEGEPMIQELAPPATRMALRIEDEHREDPAAFFRGVLLAAGVSVPAWVGLIWALTKIG